MLTNFSEKIFKKGLREGWTEDKFIENCGFKRKKDLYEAITNELKLSQEEIQKYSNMIKRNGKNEYLLNKKKRNFYDFNNDFFIPVIDDNMTVFPEFNPEISESLDIISAKNA